MSDNAETAILAGGCFWPAQELLRHRDGVISTRVGYTGGKNDNPTGENHPGHAEAVEIVFDPERISYRTCSRSSIRATSSARSPRTRSPTPTPQASGPARS
jgi:peptide methionine sulfoxide reductase MsrA